MNLCFILLLFGFMREAGKEQRTWRTYFCFWHWCVTLGTSLGLSWLPQLKNENNNTCSFVWAPQNFIRGKSDTEKWGFSRPSKIGQGEDSEWWMNLWPKRKWISTNWDDGLASWEPKMDSGIDFKKFRVWLSTLQDLICKPEITGFLVFPFPLTNTDFALLKDRLCLT